LKAFPDKGFLTGMWVRFHALCSTLDLCVVPLFSFLIRE